MPLQQRVLKKPMVMYLLGEFVLKVGVEGLKFLRKMKIEHTHGYIVSMLKKNYKRLTASLRFCC